MNLDSPQSKLLLRLMSAASLRSDVLAANLVNQNTPGFQRREVRFEDRLVKELDRSNPRLDSVQPEVVVDADAEEGANGNTVNMEKEVSAMRENRLLYELYANILQGRTRLLELAIRDSR